MKKDIIDLMQKYQNAILSENNNDLINNDYIDFLCTKVLYKVIRLYKNYKVDEKYESKFSHAFKIITECYKLQYTFFNEPRIERLKTMDTNSIEYLKKTIILSEQIIANTNKDLTK